MRDQAIIAGAPPLCPCYVCIESPRGISSGVPTGVDLRDLSYGRRGPGALCRCRFHKTR